MKASNHEMAKKYMQKIKLMGIKPTLKLELLPDDRVMVIQVTDKESKGVCRIPRFVTDFNKENSVHGRWVNNIGFDGCNFTEVYIDNSPNIDFDACGLFSRMKSTYLKVRFSHPEKIISTRRMFRLCENLVKLDIDGLDTSNVIDMSSMFNSCSNLRQLDLTNFNTHKVRDMSAMFGACSALISIDVSSFDTTSLISSVCMFAGCSEMQELDAKNFYTPNLIKATSMFESCHKLKKLDISNLSLRSIKNADYILSGCRQLKELSLPDSFVSSLAPMLHPFDECLALNK